MGRINCPLYLDSLLHRSSSRPEDVALWAEVEKVGACEEGGQANRQLARSALGVAHDACRACRPWCRVSARLHGSGFALVLSSFGLNSEVLHESLVLVRAPASCVQGNLSATEAQLQQGADANHR
jgi:hypothetical protein